MNLATNPAAIRVDGSSLIENTPTTAKKLCIVLIATILVIGSISLCGKGFEAYLRNKKGPGGADGKTDEKEIKNRGKGLVNALYSFVFASFDAHYIQKGIDSEVEKYEKERKK